MLNGDGYARLMTVLISIRGGKYFLDVDFQTGIPTAGFIRVSHDHSSLMN